MHSSKVGDEKQTDDGHRRISTRSGRIIRDMAVVAGSVFLVTLCVSLGLVCSTSPVLASSNPRGYTCCVVGSNITTGGEYINCAGYQVMWQVVYGTYYDARCPLDPVRSVNAMVDGPCRADYDMSLADQATKPVDADQSHTCYVFDDGRVVWMTTSIHVSIIAVYIFVGDLAYGALLVVIGVIVYIVLSCIYHCKRSDDTDDVENTGKQ